MAKVTVPRATGEPEAVVVAVEVEAEVDEAVVEVAKEAMPILLPLPHRADGWLSHMTILLVSCHLALTTAAQCCLVESPPT